MLQDSDRVYAHTWSSFFVLLYCTWPTNTLVMGASALSIVDKTENIGVPRNSTHEIYVSKL